MQSELFVHPRSGHLSNNQCGEHRHLEQFFTPEWAAVRLLEEFYPHLNASDFVVEPACGPGAFLKAIPSHVPAIGIEIDPKLAAQAAENTDRDVLCGDFRTVSLPRQPTAVIGNPPWNVADVTALLSHYHELLPESGEVGIIIPAHRLSYSGPVLAWARDWSIRQTLLPKSLFPRLSWPVVFAQFRKEQIRRMVGFFLFDEAEAMKGTTAKVRLLLVNGKKRVSLWKAIVLEALRSLGERATLSQIYNYVEGRRPKIIATWRDTIRRVLQEGPFKRFEDGTWALA